MVTMGYLRAVLAAAFIALLSIASAASAQPAPAQPQPAAKGDANFVIGPNDKIRVTVWNHANISGEYTIERDGSFTFPLIGRVDATGMTVVMLEQELRRQLMNGFYKDPQVTAALVENRSSKIFLVGELRTPGAYPITGEVTLIEALAKAGSTGPEAADHALIIRSDRAQGPVMPGQDASAKVTRIDLRELGTGRLSADAMVHEGDTVYVPRAANIYIYGEVRRPGSYPIGQATTVRQALSLAGGVSDFGAVNRLKILRIVDGAETTLKARLDDLLKPGDTLIVPERYF
jgi:polysaccharide export outer membrane protein